MPLDKFFIAPYDAESGLQTDVKPWLIPDSAFSNLLNAYVFRGRVRKRFGSTWLGDKLKTRLRIVVDTTDGGGASSGIVPAAAGAIGQMFSIGDNIFTVNALGTPANLLVNGTASTATFNTSTGAFVFTGVPSTTNVYWYPALPVMGLTTYEQGTINDEITIAFDTKYAYRYVGGWERLAGETTAGAATWTGSNSEFFWATTWTGAMGAEKIFFVTNFNESEPNFMRQFNGTVWDNFRPAINATPDYLWCARILVVFKNRLLAFNTWEAAAAGPAINYQNRCRYSQIGSPLAADAWRQDIAGRGNAIDAPTTEAIITVEFIKDQLVVFFERSSWALVYTGNQAYPFTWQQINTELGAEATFSVVPFDKVALGIGNVGIHACNGANVERIDNKIPQFVFDIHNDSDGPARVAGIRDYYVEMIYWTLPDTDTNADFPFPNRVLVYNYKTGTWAINNDSITALGYFQPVVGVTWSSDLIGWTDSVAWGSGSLQSKFRQVIAGNQEGYTFILNADVPTNAAVLQITDITTTPITTLTIINHNLRLLEYIYISECAYSDASDGLNNQIFQIIGVPDNNTVELSNPASFTGTYVGGGVVARVSVINITTKQYNFYAQQGRDAYVERINFMVDRTSVGQMTVDFFASSNLTSLLQAGGAGGTNSIVGTCILETSPYTTVPFEADADRLWHPVYFSAEGEVVSFQISMSDTQIKTVIEENNSFTGPALVDFQLHAMIIYAMPTSTRLQ